MSILDTVTAARYRRLRQAWLVLGSAPGPGPDFRIVPLTNLIFTLEPLTAAGETFAMMFYPLRMIGGGTKLVAFKRHCAEFDLTFDVAWAQEAQEL